MAKPNLMERVGLLVGEQGRRWKDIVSVLEREGYGESSQPLTPNTIRKRYERWLKAADKKESTIPEPKEFADKDWPVRSQRLPSPQTDLMISAREVLELLKDSMERRDSILANQIQNEHEKEFADVLEHRLETRLTEKINVKIQETVQSAVAEAQRTLQHKETAFRQELCSMVEEIVTCKITNHLALLLDGIKLKEKSAGPGRGHKGSSVTKFSATIPVRLYDEMKSLGGILSSHLAAACELYLRASKSILPEATSVPDCNANKMRC